MSAIPTSTSPITTRFDQKAAFGRTTACRKAAYQLVTSGWSPAVLASAPLTKPVMAPPALAPNQAGFWILLQPASSHA